MAITSFMDQRGTGTSEPVGTMTRQLECRDPPAEEAIEALAVADYAAIVLELPLSGCGPPHLLEAVQRTAPGVPVLARDSNASVAEAVQLAHLGTYQFLPAGGDGFD